MSVIGIIIAAVVLLIIIFASVRIVNEYERGVVFRLGRYVGVRGPGLIFLIPFIERMVKVEFRVVTMDVPQQEVHYHGYGHRKGGCRSIFPCHEAGISGFEC